MPPQNETASCKGKVQMDNRPIGVFDSGLGGLTTVKRLIKYLPG